jgi:hypothetical protein
MFPACCVCPWLTSCAAEQHSYFSYIGPAGRLHTSWWKSRDEICFDSKATTECLQQHPLVYSPSPHVIFLVGECEAIEGCVLNKYLKQDCFKRHVLILFNFAIVITDRSLLRSNHKLFCFKRCRSRRPDIRHFPRFIIAFHLSSLQFHWFQINLNTVYPSILRPTSFLFLPCMLHVFHVIGVDFVLPEALCKV